MSYTYRSTDGALTDYYIDGSQEIHVNYDRLNRISTRNLYQGRSTVFNLQISNTYVPGAAANQTTGLVSQQNYNFVDGEDFELHYEYDNLGNIERISDGNNNTLGVYRYGSQNQLVYEEVYDAGTFVDTRAYYYDTYGNIREVKHFSLCNFHDMSDLSMQTPTSVETYAYPALDTSFRDKLTSYNNHTITYDGVGNPLSYYNGSTYTMTWQKGRQLASVTKGGVQTTYTYDSDGIRRSKTVGVTRGRFS